MEEEHPPKKRSRLMDDVSSAVEPPPHAVDDDEQQVSQGAEAGPDAEDGLPKAEQSEDDDGAELIGPSDASNTPEASGDDSPPQSPSVALDGSFTLADLTPKEPAIALPAVSHSADHFVCYRLPWDADQEPSPHPEKTNWDHKDLKNFVPLPFYNKIKRQTRNQEPVQHWSRVKEALEVDIEDVEQLVTAIKKCSFKTLKCDLLAALFDESSRYDARYSEADRLHIFEHTIPGMQRLALQLPELVTQPLPFLKGGQSLSLTQMQVASLLANAFFCTFTSRSRSNDKLPDINFAGLYYLPWGDSSQVEANMEKIKCLLTYFRKILDEKPNGVVTFHRRRLSEEDTPDWTASEKPITRLHVSRTGTIEDDGKYMLQMDFANKYLGGGVLGHGCVQEEIRFAISPECIAGCLFCEVMDDSEAILICGAERFCSYQGYGSSFKRLLHFDDATPRDSSGRRCTSIVAIDAIPLYRDRRRQYEERLMRRELNKAYVGFLVDDGAPSIPVATGNWGCGVFGGDPRLKSVLQVLAASQCGRDVIYFTFRDKTLVDELTRLHALFRKKEATVGQVYRTLLQFQNSRWQRRNVIEFLERELGNSGSVLPFTKKTPVKDVPNADAEGAASQSSIEEAAMPSATDKEALASNTNISKNDEAIDSSTDTKEKKKKQATLHDFFKKNGIEAWKGKE